MHVAVNDQKERAGGEPTGVVVELKTSKETVSREAVNDADIYCQTVSGGSKVPD